MCALGQNKLVIYFSDIVNIHGAVYPVSFKQPCSPYIILCLMNMSGKSLM